jgi:PAS domain S-box-containing protein
VRLPFGRRPADAPPFASLESSASRDSARRWWLLALAGAMAVGIASLRLISPDPSHPYFVLWIVPVLIVAVEFGVAAGVTAALISMGAAVFVDGVLADQPNLRLDDYIFRGTAIIFLGATFGIFAERLRRNSEAQARFWELSSDLLTVADPSGYLLRVSPSWTRTLGWTPEELTSRPFLEFVHPDDQEASRAELERVIRGKGTDFENRYAMPDGSYRLLQWRAAAEPETGHIAAVARDVTERAEIQRRLEEAVEDATRANEAKSEFLSRMSHELRTPLNAILGFSQLLEMAELEETDRESVRHIREAGDHLLRLVGELLETAVIEAGQISISVEPVDAGAILDEVVALLEPLAIEARVQLRAERPETGPVVLADPQRLTQILINLISNAVKYNRRGGSVVVSCDTRAIDGWFDPGAFEGCFVVADDGPGMDTEQLEAVFEPFERLGAERARIEGTGLGLPLARRLAELMDGSLEAESTPGRGTVMRICLRLADAQPASEAGAPAGAMNVNGNGNTLARGAGTERAILCIEDDDASAELVERALGQTGRPLRFFRARDALRGLERVRDSHPDVILLDLDLPDMHGSEVLRILRSEPDTAQLPVIVITAAAADREAEALLAAGADAFLTKPVDVARLRELALGKEVKPQ